MEEDSRYSSLDSSSIDSCNCIRFQLDNPWKGPGEGVDVVFAGKIIEATIDSADTDPPPASSELNCRFFESWSAVREEEYS